jgi:hypothetical protein
MNPYAPWTPPFRYDDEGQMIYDAKNERVLDMRGWGFLTGKGSLGWMEARAARKQDEIGRRVVTLMNNDATSFAQEPEPDAETLALLGYPAPRDPAPLPPQASAGPAV